MEACSKLVKLMIFLTLFTFCHGGKISAGKCQNTASQFFTLMTFLGSYRVHARSPDWTLHGLDCIEFAFTTVAGVSPFEYSLVVTGINKRSGVTETLTGRMNAYGISMAFGGFTTENTAFSITLPNQYFSKPVVYKVLRLSPNILVLYSCQDHVFGKLENALVLYKTDASALEINTALNKLIATGYPEHGLIYSYMNC